MYRRNGTMHRQLWGRRHSVCGTMALVCGTKPKRCVEHKGTSTVEHTTEDTMLQGNETSTEITSMLVKRNWQQDLVSQPTRTNGTRVKSTPSGRVQCGRVETRSRRRYQRRQLLEKERVHRCFLLHTFTREHAGTRSNCSCITCTK